MALTAPHHPVRAQEFGVGAIPWSPLARGALARPAGELKDTARGQTDAWASGYVGAGSAEVNARCVALSLSPPLSLPLPLSSSRTVTYQTQTSQSHRRRQKPGR